ALAVTRLETEGEVGGFRVTLKLIGESFEIIDVPEGDLARHFEERADQENAERLHDRDVSAALALPLKWHARVHLDLGRLVEGPAWIDARVAMSHAWLTAEIERSGVRGTTLLVPQVGSRRLFLCADGPDAAAHFGAVSLMGVASRTELPPPAPPLAGEHAASSDVLALPSQLAPFQPELAGPWERAARVLAAAFVASTWHRLASAVVEDGAAIEILGFKRVKPRLLEPSELSDEVIDGTRRLHAWAFQDLSPDRLLAVRQVVSLYLDDSAIRQPADVLDSAELVFVGLRSDAVADAMQSARDAQGQAAETVRQSLKSVQDMLRSATERLFASLVAVAAVVVANATTKLSDRAGRDLLLAVAGYLALLGLVHVVLEGPLLTLPLRTLDDDLKKSQPMLTETQRQRAVALPSMTATRARVRRLRVLVPVVYGLLATAIFVWGYPGRYR
ncbi:MAG: hypothetical protein QOJ29_1297, partial [Thermoleophilaceae bacterium]|nr:hypothetical protein [Thermoleophilaceae bacterium]